MGFNRYIPASVRPTLIRGRDRVRRSMQALDKRTFSDEEFYDLLGGLGVAPGAAVMVHSSMNAILRRVPTMNPTNIVEHLQTELGADGTLLMPTFPFEGFQRDYAQTLHTYDPSRTPSKMGLLSEVFRRLPDVVRSLHPTHPVAAWGRHAIDLTRVHLLGTTFGKNSPFHKLRELNGTVIGLGVSPTVFTLFHVVEELHATTYEYNYDDTIIPMTIANGDQPIVYELNALRTDRQRDYWPAIRILRREGVLGYEKYKGLEVCSTRVADFIDRTLGIIDEGRFLKEGHNGTAT